MCSARGGFVRRFVKDAQSGSAVSPVARSARPTPGTPSSLITSIEHLAHKVFASGYVTAMHLTMIMPIAVIAIAGISCLAVKKDTGAWGAAPVTDVGVVPEASQAPA